MYRMLFILLLFTSACGMPLGYINPEFQPYVDDFTVSTGIVVKYTDIDFGEMPEGQSGMIGQCKPNGSIVINKEYWDALPKFDSDPTLKRKALIWHELGHCVMALPHNTQKLSDGCPASYMNANMPKQSCLIEHGEAYAREFNK